MGAPHVQRANSKARNIFRLRRRISSPRNKRMDYKRWWICLLIVPLLATGCKKDKPCHDTITVYNGSADTVLLGIRHGGYESDSCHLESPATIPPNSGWADKVRVGCWENQFAASSLFRPEFYFVQNGGLNDPGNDYQCDSLDQYNTILQHNVLSLADLKAMNFVLRYQ